MGRKPMSDERRQEILAAYAAWDPTEKSVDELVRELGTSKQTLYRLRREEGVSMKRFEETQQEPSLRPGDVALAGELDELLRTGEVGWGQLPTGSRLSALAVVVGSAPDGDLATLRQLVEKRRSWFSFS